jgi:DNA-binding transcriptional LysR family regulator
MLDRWRLLLFREVARTGTVAAAAEAVYVTPSAVSQQLRLLQRDAGIELFERNGRRIELTPDAVVFLEHVNAILAKFEEAEVALAGFRREVVGTVRLAAFPSAARFLAPTAIANAHAVHERLRIVLHDLEPDEAIEQLRSGQQDVAVVDDLDPRLGHDIEGLARTPLFEDPLVVAMPRRHRLMRADRVTLRDLADESWITEVAGRYFENRLRDACAAAGFEPRVGAHSRDLGVTLALIEAGCGIAVLPRLTVSEPRGGFGIRALDPAWVRHVFVVTRTTTTSHPAIAAVAESLVAAATRFSR